MVKYLGNNPGLYYASPYAYSPYLGVPPQLPFYAYATQPYLLWRPGCGYGGACFGRYGGCCGSRAPWVYPWNFNRVL